MSVTATERYTQQEIDDLGKQGKAFKNPDGHYSYPIDNATDLSNAIHAVGRGGADHNAIRKYIIGRAKSLGLFKEIPDNWGSDGSISSGKSEGEEILYGIHPGVPRHGDVALRATSEGEWMLREKPDDESLGILSGHFAVFNRWTKINGFWEGEFMERVAPGAFTKTFSENRKGMRCLFQHGKDPATGMKPLGDIADLEQDDTGARYDVNLFDANYVRELLPGLKAGAYGASFRFQVMREEVNTKPQRSDDNPEGIEERTITEAKVREFGPVTFPAYADATAGIRSLTDDPDFSEINLERMASSNPELTVQYLNHLRGRSRGEPVRDADRDKEFENTPPEETNHPAPPPRAPGRHRSTLSSGAALPLRPAGGQPPWKL